MNWTLAGWETHAWRLRRSVELDTQLVPEIGPVPARVPGSVHSALRAAGEIPDWEQGLNVYACEWVEHRHWEFAARLPAVWFAAGFSVWLDCQGLDYGGSLLVDNQVVASFAGTLLPHRFNLSQFLTPGSEHLLAFIFEGAPAEQNQFGFTSRSQYFKPRFAYRWDWCPRMVALGFWDSVTLEIGNTPRLLNVRPQATLAASLHEGSCAIECKLAAPEALRVRLVAELKAQNKIMAQASGELDLQPGEQTASLLMTKLDVDPWQVNGIGGQPLYDLNVRLEPIAGGEAHDAAACRVGFKRVEWQPCAGASADALPWICNVNGHALFLQGINWTPIRTNYHDLTRADYEQRLRTYAEMGCNLIRVWGGGLIERRDFYELCDELGLLVWQEFPLSSSGIENTPPDDAKVLATLQRIAESAVERRDGHVCMLIWCGGNELQSGPERSLPGGGWPWDESHPCLKMLGDVVRASGSTARFLPTSGFGPAFSVDPQRLGEGRHHLVHGPWRVEGRMQAWEEYWNSSDALFHAETGCPGASPLDLLERHHGDQPLWPADASNHYWRYPGLWWIGAERFGPQVAGMDPDAALAEFIRLSQAHQAEALRIVARACKRRFPGCGGLLFWMGHDCFPVTSNTSLLDFEGKPKPAAEAVAEIFRAKPEQLKQDRHV